jgi:hypothetical protein
VKNLLFAAAFCGAGLLDAHLCAEEASSFYLLGGLDGKLLADHDTNTYFNVSDSFKPQGYPSGVVHLGYQYEKWLALEASADLGLSRTYSVSYASGLLGTTRNVSAQWGLSTYSLTPAFTWAGRGYAHLLGLRLGVASLNGHVDDDADGVPGSYDERSSAFDFGVLFRSSRMVSGPFSLGFELGYDWTRFSDVSTANGTGAYRSVSSPERNISAIGHRGNVTALDFSGAHIAIVLGLWSEPYVNREAEAFDCPKE